MPYALVFIENGERKEIKPLACNNPKSEYGFEDRRIYQEGKKYTSKMQKRFKGLECFIEHYELRKNLGD